MRRMRVLASLSLVVFVLSSCNTTRPGERRDGKRQSLFGSLGLSAEQPMNMLPESNETNSMLRGRVTPREIPMPQNNAARPNTFPPTALSRELVKVDGNVWRSSVDAVQLFSMLSRLLSQNYLLTSVDRKNLALSTDWDKFFIDGRLFRNRLSISVFPVGHRQTEVVLKNMVEYFSGNPNKPEEMTLASWLPSPDITDEVARVVDSLNKQIAFYQSQPSQYR